MAKLAGQGRLGIGRRTLGARRVPLLALDTPARGRQPAERRARQLPDMHVARQHSVGHVGGAGRVLAVAEALVAAGAARREGLPVGPARAVRIGRAAWPSTVL
jgi:hypothetical protein